jgi:hypothetical protein
MGDEWKDWARVIVRKSRASGLNIAADVNVGAKSKLQGLPNTHNEFLGALLGVNAKNWLNMLERVRELSDFTAMQKELDGLAKDFLAEWLDKGFEEIPDEFDEFLGKVRKVGESYHNLDNSAITLFDRYFDRLDVLQNKLDQLAALTSWDQLRGKIDDDLWSIVGQLTDGDPLEWMLGRLELAGPNGQPIEVDSLEELKKRVDQAFSVIRDSAHDEIRSFIALAKQKFGLDPFMKELAKVDSIPELKAIADERLGAFVERLLVTSMGHLSNSELGKIVTRLNRVLNKINDFEERFYEKVTEAASQAMTFNLHAEYNRTNERGVLVDVLINMATEEGKELMSQAGQGNFEEVLAGYQSDSVRILTGVLTNKRVRASAFNINIVGWHAGWHYQGFDKVIVDTEQQIQASDDGSITVFTTMEMKKEKERIRNGETMYTNFSLRFLGESGSVLEFDRRNQQYLMDTLTGKVAEYQLLFDDKRTTAKELRFYLSFAEEFDLAAKGATFKQLDEMLPKTKKNNYGRVNAQYQVRYTKEGLETLFQAAFDARKVRALMRNIVLSNYLRRSPALTKMGWCYWSDDVYGLWRKGQAEFTNFSSRSFKFKGKGPMGLTLPKRITLRRHELRVVSTLFYVEDRLAGGLERIYQLIQSGIKMSPHEFENALEDFGKGLKLFDDFDEGVNTVFGVFDGLIKLRLYTARARASSLTLSSNVKIPDRANGRKVKTQKVTKVFVS